MIDVNRYLAFLEKHRLAQNQFLLLYCLYTQNYDAIRKYKDIFPSGNDDSMVGSVLMEDLFRRNFLRLKHGKTEGKVAANLEVTELFTQLFFDPFEAADQIYDAYPDFFYNKGDRFPTKNWSEDILRTTYWNKTNGMLHEHKEVLLDIAYGVKHNLVSCKLQTFVEAAGWRAFRRIRIGEDKNPKATIKRERA